MDLRARWWSTSRHDLDDDPSTLDYAESCRMRSILATSAVEDSIERKADEIIERAIEWHGRLHHDIAAPFPLEIICDMMAYLRVSTDGLASLEHHPLQR